MSLNDVLTNQANLLRAKTGDTEKLTLGRMNDLIGNLEWGQYNMLDGTSDQYRTVDTGNTSASNSMVSMDGFHTNDRFTYSATIKNVSTGKVVLDVWQCDNQGSFLDSKLYPAEWVSNNYASGNDETDLSINFYITSYTFYLRFYFTGTKGATLQVKNERLYTGNLPGVWRPSLNDIIRGGQINFFPYWVASLYFLDFIGMEV